MKIGILQPGTAPDSLIEKEGDYPDMCADMLDGNGFVFKTWKVIDGDFPKTVTECDGWIILGSRHGVYENHEWLPQLEHFIQEVFAAKRPIIGICFGHQVIAKAMGGTVEKFDGGWCIGATEYDFGKEKLTLNTWHQDQVITPPAGAKTIAQNAFCTHAALSYDKQALTFQAHPEFTAPVMAELIKDREDGDVPKRLLDHAKSRLKTPLNTGTIANKIALFFKNNRD